MLGAIAGDMIGSVYEFNNRRTKEFPLFTDHSTFTDDSILSVAVADVLLNGGTYTEVFRYYCQKYPDPMGGYGARFAEWASAQTPEPYQSWGNGAAMRVSPVAYAFKDLDAVLLAARETALVSHNHPEGIKGAQATAAAIFLARTGQSKADIKAYIASTCAYDLDRSLDQIRPVYQFNESCQQTVPEAMIAFLESTDFEDAIRNAVSLGGDSDTLTCITGAIAEAFYGEVPEAIAGEVWQRLDPHLAAVVRQFRQTFEFWLEGE